MELNIQMESVLKIINDKFELLSKQQKKLGQFFITNYERAAFMTAAKVASETGVSEATVVRFASFLGYEGYPEFQKAIKEDAKSRMNSIKRMEIVSEKIKEEDVLKNVLKSDMAQIEKTIERIDTAQFHDAIDKIVNSKNIYIVGMRSSATLAAFMGFYFNMMFENVRVISGNSAEGVIEKMIRIDDKDVVIGISFPRYSASVIKALDFAKQRGSKIISITDSINSPIVKYSECNLLASSEMDSFADSLVAPMSIINALILAIGYKKKAELERVFSDIEEVLEQQEVYD